MTKKAKAPTTDTQAAPKPKRPDPTPSEVAAIERARQANEQRLPPPAFAVEVKDGAADLSQGHSDLDGWRAQMCAAFASQSNDFIHEQITWLATVTAAVNRSETTSEQTLNSAIALVAAVKPRDEVETALAVQMAAAHALSLTLLTKAARSTDSVHIDRLTTAATKTQRTFTAQFEALAKARRGGQQHVKVEHVHVHAGGQAVVGVVNGGAAGRGVTENGVQADEIDARSLAYAPGAPLWSEDPEGDALPVAGRPREA